jgi:hypothetical protein
MDAVLHQDASISLNRVFITSSLGLRPAHCSQFSILLTLISCEVAGAFTLIDRRVEGSGAFSVNRQRRNSAMDRAAASYNVLADTSTVWRMPSPSVKETRQLRALDYSSL